MADREILFYQDYSRLFLTTPNHISGAMIKTATATRAIHPVIDPTSI